MIVFAFTLTLLSASPSASTLAAVAVFAANVDRTWPADEREPFVTAEALRLMEVAGRSIADDLRVNSGVVRKSLDAFASTRAALEGEAREEERPRYAREALARGRAMLAALAAALHMSDGTTRQRLAALDKSADDINRKRALRKQRRTIEDYFRQAAGMMRALLDAQAFPFLETFPIESRH